MRTITKKELVHRIAERTGQTKVVAKEVIQVFLDSMIEELACGNRLEFREFGVFETKLRAARLARNPHTNDDVHVPARRTVKFKPGRLMRERVCDAEDAAAGQTPADPGRVTPETQSGASASEATGESAD